MSDLKVRGEKRYLQFSYEAPEWLELEGAARHDNHAEVRYWVLSLIEKRKKEIENERSDGGHGARE